MSLNESILDKDGKEITAGETDGIFPIIIKDSFKRKFRNQLADNELTPDMARLMQYEFHHIFVYGTLKTGEDRIEALKAKGGKLVGYGTTIGPEFVMAEYTSQGSRDHRSSFPVVLHRPKSTDAGAIAGEIWQVPTDTMLYLDVIEANGVMYKRERRTFLVFKNQELVACQAYWYRGMDTYWGPLMRKGRDDLRPLQKLRASLFPHDYYSYTQRNK